MKVRNVIILLVVCFLLGFSGGIGIKFYYESSTFQPFTWNHKPSIINCYGKDFNRYQFERAIEYWKIRGYQIGFYEHSPPADVCESYWLDGMIILRKNNNLPHDTLANTKRMTSAFTMRGAVIYYKPGSQNLNLINEHELGHALGMTHVEKEGHVMHPQYHKMGRDFYIP
jgi:hypothetical protein